VKAWRGHFHYQSYYFDLLCVDVHWCYHTLDYLSVLSMPLSMWHFGYSTPRPLCATRRCRMSVGYFARRMPQCFCVPAASARSETEEGRRVHPVHWRYLRGVAGVGWGDLARYTRNASSASSRRRERGWKEKRRKKERTRRRMAVR